MKRPPHSTGARSSESGRAAWARVPRVIHKCDSSRTAPHRCTRCESIQLVQEVHDDIFGRSSLSAERNRGSHGQLRCGMSVARLAVPVRWCHRHQLVGVKNYIAPSGLQRTQERKTWKGVTADVERCRCRLDAMVVEDRFDRGARHGVAETLQPAADAGEHSDWTCVRPHVCWICTALNNL
jgi:hypothetical protein